MVDLMSPDPSDQTLARSRHRAIAEHMSNWFDTLRAKQWREPHDLTRSQAQPW